MKMSVKLQLFLIYSYNIHMKIPNYDSNKQESKKRSLNNFLHEVFRMMVSGQSNCGKTNTIMHMLRKPLMYYDKVYIYTPNTHQEKMKDLQTIMDSISSKVGYDIMEVKSQDDIMDTCEYPSNNRKIVVFDDLVNAPERIENKIVNHFTDGRHHQISPIYISALICYYIHLPRRTILT